MLARILKFLLVVVGLIAVIVGVGYFTFKRDDIPYETLAAKYESAASRYIDLPSGVRMHYRDEGNRLGPTLLMLHGFSASLHTWEPWVRELGAQYRIVTLDLPGHGLTAAPEDYQASIESYRDEVESFAAAQQLSRFTLIGSSMGGNVSWQYALAHPERLDALVLVDASGWEETREELAEEPPVFALLRNPILTPLLRDLDNTRLIRQGLEASFADKSLVTNDMVNRYAELSRAPGHRDILLQMTLGFRERTYATSERLAPITTPTLILHGAQDAVVVPEDAQKFHAAIAGSEVVIFETSGHIPQEEISEESAAAVRRFLAGVYAARAEAAE